MKFMEYKIKDYKDLIGHVEYRRGNRILVISKLDNINDIILQFKNDYPMFSQYNNRDCVYVMVMYDNTSQFKDIPICKCGNLCRPIWYQKDYNKPQFSKSCYNKKCVYECITETYKVNCLKKYGVDNVSKLESVKNKKIETSISHYGVPSPMKHPDVVKKLSERTMELYGVDNVSKSDIIKKKKLDTFAKNYGSLSNFAKQSFASFYKKCGIKNISELSCIKDKKCQTFLKHYGVDNIFKTCEFIDYIKKYWLEHPELKKEAYKKQAQSAIKNKMKIKHYRKGFTGIVEFDVLNEIEKNIEYKILRQVGVIQYYMDGYIPELNLNIEYDETDKHSTDDQIKDDKIRQTEIVDYINCTVIRIKESDWLIDSQKCIDTVKRTIEVIKKLDNHYDLIIEDNNKKLRVRKNLSGGQNENQTH